MAVIESLLRVALRDIKPASDRVGAGSRRLALSSLLVAGMMAAQTTPVEATGQVRGSYLGVQFETEPPQGAQDLCRRYEWACAAYYTGSSLDETALQLARKINRQVNRRVRQVEDKRQYGREEFWSLPTRKGGDCEDIALLKKAALIEQGFAPNRLLLATVLDRRKNNHAVLVLRTTQGDFILDSAKDQVSHWSKTRYSFLKMQNPDAPHTWSAVLAGGVFN